MTTTIAKTITPEQLLSLPDAVNYELIDGNLVERHMGSESSAIAAAVASILIQWNKKQRAGHVFTTDCGYQCFRNAPSKIRKPDVSFVQVGRLPGERLPDGYINLAPDLAVEVLSPGDLAYEIDEKVAEYIEAGVRLIWVINPKTKSVRVHRPANAELGPISAMKESDTIHGENVLPGFECRVAEFFDI